MIKQFKEKALKNVFAIKYNLMDNTHVLRQWMKKNKADFVIIRPDRHLFDAGRKGQEEKVLKELYGFLN